MQDDKRNLNKPSKVVINVYTRNGELVQKIIDEYKGEGSFEAIWNGKNIKNKIVASGIYLIHIHTDYFDETQKVMVIK